MTAENIFEIAIHLPPQEMDRLLDMLHKKRAAKLPGKAGKPKSFTDRQAIEYLLENVFRKRSTPS